jgi:hypothetical protein
LLDLLGSSGLGLLLKSDGSVGGTRADIQSFNNLDSVTDIAQAEIWWKFKLGETKPVRPISA